MMQISQKGVQQGADCKSLYQHLPNNIDTAVKQSSTATTAMIRSLSGDLHGMQPDPVAADILRKEPEHDTFVRLKINPIGNSVLFKWRYYFSSCYDRPVIL